MAGPSDLVRGRLDLFVDTGKRVETMGAAVLPRGE